MELAKKFVIEAARDILSDYVAQSIAKWEKVVDKYYVENAQVEPTLAVTLSDNWIQFNLRYIVDFKKRRYNRHLLHERIQEGIDATQGQVELASETFEIVRIPTLDLKSEKDN